LIERQAPFGCELRGEPGTYRDSVTQPDSVTQRDHSSMFWLRKIMGNSLVTRFCGRFS
jgi:hypothetical protein